jgi:peptidoglycan/LPS O-acetylase OafA/YrhL
METQTNRIPCLDGLRAISIGLVVISHLFWGSGYQFNSFSTGNLGVRIFFIISGFLITSILLSEWNKTSTLNLKKFYFRRTLRIFPAYYFYLLVLFLAALLGFYQTDFYTFLPSLTYTSNYLHSPIWILGHTWSLSVEEQFYLLFPGIFLILKLKDTKKFLIFILLITPIVRLAMLFLFPNTDNQDLLLTIEHSFHTNMDVLATGCLLAFSRANLHKTNFYNKFLQSKIFVAFLLATVITIAFNSNFTLFFYGIGLTLMNIFIAVSIDWMIINQHTIFGKILNSKPLVFAGALSYSLYLWQEPFTKYSAELIWTQFPFNIILMILFSLFSYYIIERRFLQLRQYLEKSLFSNGQEKPLLQNNIHPEII